MQRLAGAVDHPALDKPGDPRRRHLRMQAKVSLAFEGTGPSEVHARLPGANLDRRPVRHQLAHVSGDRPRVLRRLGESEHAPHLGSWQPRHHRPDHNQPVEVFAQLIDDAHVRLARAVVLHPAQPRLDQPARYLHRRNLDEGVNLAYVNDVVPAHGSQAGVNLRDYRPRPPGVRAFVPVVRAERNVPVLVRRRH